jgi:hypothetical protein
VGRFRRAHLVPVPEVGSLRELNDLLEVACVADLKRTIRGRRETVGRALQPAPHDRRKRVVSLTDQGRKTRLRLAHCIGERQPSFRALTTDELAAFRDMLRRVAAEGGVVPRPSG